MLFCEETLTSRPYNINKISFITKQVQIIDKMGFIIAALDADSKTLIVYKIIQKQEKWL